MPRYGRIQYGVRHKYGRYEGKTTDNFSVGPHIRYRIRTHNKEDVSPYAQMMRTRMEVSIPYQPLIRIRANDGEWVTIDRAEIPQEVFHVRMRGISNTYEPWIHCITTTVEREDDLREH